MSEPEIEVHSHSNIERTQGAAAYKRLLNDLGEERENWRKAEAALRQEWDRLQLLVHEQVEWVRSWALKWNAVEAERDALREAGESLAKALALHRHGEECPACREAAAAVRAWRAVERDAG